MSYYFYYYYYYYQDKIYCSQERGNQSANTSTRNLIFELQKSKPKRVRMCQCKCWIYFKMVCPERSIDLKRLWLNKFILKKKNYFHHTPLVAKGENMESIVFIMKA